MTGTRVGLFAGVLTLALLASPPGRAETRSEIWPELNAFVKLSRRQRLVLHAAFVGTRESGNSSGSNGADSMELGAALDITLKPILRRSLQSADWERQRYLWARIGYSYSTDVGDAEDTSREHRILLELTARAPLPQHFWLVHRGRIDLRDKDGNDSRRYRYRLTIERDAVAFGKPVVPYINAEFYYDSRFDTWNRERYQVGVEIELSAIWRVELTTTHQHDRRFEPEYLEAIGLALKYYR